MSLPEKLFIAEAVVSVLVPGVPVGVLTLGGPTLGGPTSMQGCRSESRELLFMKWSCDNSQAPVQACGRIRPNFASGGLTDAGSWLFEVAL